MTPPDTPAPDDTPARLRRAARPDPARLAALEEDLGRRAAAEGLVEVAHRTLDSPLGPLLVAATGRGLVRVAFAAEDFDAVVDDLAARLGPRVLRAPARLDGVAAQLEQYFAGRRRDFDLPLDRALSRGFRAQVHRRLSTIPAGETRSYGDLARELGNPRAVRAVGTACATNPLPVVVPCHRVLRADGSLGGYLGGVHLKEHLLRLEGAWPVG